MFGSYKWHTTPVSFNCSNEKGWSKKFLIVGGYKRETLAKKGYNVVPNLEFQNTNMVWSLTQAIEHIDNASCEYVVIHYGDILVSYKNILSLREIPTMNFRF